MRFMRDARYLLCSRLANAHATSNYLLNMLRTLHLRSPECSPSAAAMRSRECI
jgi:hypothetical protein